MGLRSCGDRSSAAGLQRHQRKALAGLVRLQLLGLQTALELLLEGGGGDGVEEGVQGTVDGQDEDDHPRGDGTCANMVALRLHWTQFWASLSRQGFSQERPGQMVVEVPSSLEFSEH